MGACEVISLMSKGTLVGLSNLKEEKVAERHENGQLKAGEDVVEQLPCPWFSLLLFFEVSVRAEHCFVV